ncbi:MAG: magnesium chelatase subunit [Pseudonocardiales bacterium]|nr:magnesium chelatase subunit [Pseudonocardiales bacterium]
MSQFPFTAVVGMDDLRLSLLLNAVSPAIGGVLVRGEKGTAKSTAVRALAAVLPRLSVVEGCRFQCDPTDPDPNCPDGPHSVDQPAEIRPARLVELPVGASEDRLVGSLDIERALTDGVKSFEPGLLATAHRGVLYVDEVNLLHDHLVDLLLDAAALGTSYVEREGVSIRHASRFLLVGTMNPEEGELRPQLLDRFGLTVEVAAPRNPAVRADVVRRRLAFDADAIEFTERFAVEERDLSARIVGARRLLPEVVLSDEALQQITAVCASFNVDGLRADIVTARTAAAHAAWHGRTDITEDDIRVAARLSLPHRRRRNPFDAPGLDEAQLEQALADSRPPEPDGPDPDGPDPDGPDSDGPDPDGPGPDSSGHSADTDALSDPDATDPSTSDRTREAAADQAAGQAPEHSTGSSGDRVAAPSAAFRARRLEVPGLGAGAAGRRSRAETEYGRTTRVERPVEPVRHVHLTATMIAAAPHQRSRGRTGRGLLIRKDDLRQSVREGREGNLILFLVDASGSMAARSRMSAVKGAVLSLLLDAYQRRDKVGLISFRGHDAELVLPPTSSVDTAAARLEVLATGGRTPLTAGLLRASETLRVERMRDPLRRPLLVVVTDGRHTAGEDPTRAAALLARQQIASVVVDCESGPVRLNMAGTLAQTLAGSCLQLSELAAGSLADTVRLFKDAA